MATIKLPANGQTLTDIPDYIANDDKLLRDLLSPTLPDLANATFERKTEGDLLTVTVVKKAGTKGGDVKFTPGPLIALKGHDGEPDRWAVVTKGEWQYLIAVIENGQPGDTLETEGATAHLFAAAPDLYEELIDRNLILGSIAMAALQNDFNAIRRVVRDYMIIMRDGAPFAFSPALAKADGEQ